VLCPLENIVVRFCSVRRKPDVHIKFVVNKYFATLFNLTLVISCSLLVKTLHVNYVLVIVKLNAMNKICSNFQGKDNAPPPPPQRVEAKVCRNPCIFENLKKVLCFNWNDPAFIERLYCM